MRKGRKSSRDAWYVHTLSIYRQSLIFLLLTKDILLSHNANILVGPTVTRPVQDTLGVLPLDNQLSINYLLCIIGIKLMQNFEKIALCALLFFYCCLCHAKPYFLQSLSHFMYDTFFNNCLTSKLLEK